MEKEAYTRCLKETFAIEAECLREGAAAVDMDEFEKAVKLLAEAPKIGASGCGHSGIACRDFAHLMCCIERPARFISPAEAVHGATGFLEEGDAMLFLSRGGKTGELLPILDICKKKEGSCDYGNRKSTVAPCPKCGCCPENAYYPGN